jgi:predicted PhzF superfamily epimerase YddE/YHI9
LVRLASGIVDVFAETALSGNPLAVVEGADAVPDATLRKIAREFNQAETNFIMRSSRADKKLRSFTASGAEVFGAGRNALGVGLWEDSATGTAAGPLCAYLGSSEMLAPDNTLIVEQGALMGRRSMLHVRLAPDPQLSGSGVVVMSGELILPEIA